MLSHINKGMLKYIHRIVCTRFCDLIASIRQISDDENAVCADLDRVIGVYHIAACITRGCVLKGTAG